VYFVYFFFSFRFYLCTVCTIFIIIIIIINKVSRYFAKTRFSSFPNVLCSFFFIFTYPRLSGSKILKTSQSLQENTILLFIMKRYCECSVFLINFRDLLAKSAGYFYGPPDIHVLRRNDMKNAPLSTTMVTYTTQLPVILSFENLLLQQWTLNLLLWSKIYLLKYLYSDYRRGIRKRKIVY